MNHYKTGGDWAGVGEHRFEGMASEIVGAHLNENGRYRRGWITKRGGDGGIDFVGRLDLGAAESGLKLVVLGQAKCKTGGTGGQDLARTVARLDRGWVGAFVTTGHFSQEAQREIVSDRFPLLLVNGRQVGETVVTERCLRGSTSDLHPRGRRGIRRTAVEPPPERDPCRGSSGNASPPPTS